MPSLLCTPSPTQSRTAKPMRVCTYVQRTSGCGAELRIIQRGHVSEKSTTSLPRQNSNNGQQIPPATSFAAPRLFLGALTVPTPAVPEEKTLTLHSSVEPAFSLSSTQFGEIMVRAFLSVYRTRAQRTRTFPFSFVWYRHDGVCAINQTNLWEGCPLHCCRSLLPTRKAGYGQVAADKPGVY